MSQSKSNSADAAASSSNFADEAASIVRTSSEDLSEEGVIAEIEQMKSDYKVPGSEAAHMVANKYNASLTSLDTIEDIQEAEEWFDLEVEVLEIWDASDNDEAIGQVGLLGDETGVIKFTAWATSDLQELVEGETYRLSGVVSDEFQDRVNIKLNASTEIESIDADIEVPDGEEEVEVSGFLVDFQSGSGLIKRCPEEDCTRVLNDGRCQEHGEVDGEFDLRLKAIIDDGAEPHQVIFNKEQTENLLGMSIEEAKQEAMDALDTGVVLDFAKEALIGEHFEVTGGDAGNYIIAESYGVARSSVESKERTRDEARELLAALEA